LSAVMILGDSARWPQEGAEAPDYHYERTQAEEGGPDDAFPANACFQNPHFRVRGVLHRFKRSLYSLLQPSTCGLLT
jgi:hypothetical protein